MTCLALVAITLTTLAAHGADDSDDDFVPLFNGRDLTGWVPIFIDWSGPGQYDFSDMDLRIRTILDL